MKKKVYLVILCILLVGITPYTMGSKIHHDEMRAVWIATVSKLDYPKTAQGAQAQMNEFEAYLDELVDIGINTIMVQVRPKADALYTSQINPWSDVLTDVQGQYPGYDPLAFMIKEAHERNMSFHAWLNPYRVTQPGYGLEDLVAHHPARVNPEWTMTYNNAVYYNPAVEEVKQHVENTVQEIVANYDVDGIHFDDYFYPYNYPLPEGETRDGVVGNERRDHITDMVRRVGEIIKKTDDGVLFGISPFGIWKNDHFDPDGSNTNGGESYYSVYADTKKWVEYEYMDYVVPQIYWEIGHSAADYETLVDWWNELVKGTDVKLYIGQGIYKDDVAREITEQLEINEDYPRVEGSVYFSLKDLLGNRQNVKSQVTAYYKGEVVTPPATPSPEQPQVPEEDEVVEMQNTVIIGEGISTGSNVNIRKGPSTQYNIVGKLQATDQMSIYGKSNGWYFVRTSSGTEGFVSGDYVEVTDKSSSDIELMINGGYVKPTVTPRITNGTTLVPLRVISENLGAQVDWNGQTKQITITDQNTTIKLSIGSTTITVNGNTGTISLAPQIINSTTMVPIRFVSETIGASVDWDGLLKLISVEM